MTPAIFGMQQPGYSHLRDYISELGANGAPYADWVNYFGFLPIGVLVLFVCFMLPAILPKNRITIAACIFLLSLSIAYVGASIAPCDLGCPAEGSP